MTTPQAVLLVIYIIGVVIASPIFWLETYRKGFSDGSLRPGNPRAATVVAILYGPAWPILVVLMLCFAFAFWIQDGGR